jgi:hypothetical protein
MAVGAQGAQGERVEGGEGPWERRARGHDDPTALTLSHEPKRYTRNLDSRSPDGWDQIPYRPGGWVLHQPPWSFGFDSQTRATRENRRTLC